MSTINNSDLLEEPVWRNGFTLIEICMVILISGFILIGAADLYKLYIRSTAATATAQRMTDIRSALLTYFSQKGVLPCPANPAVPQSSAAYGASICPPGLPALPAGAVITAASVRVPALLNPSVLIGSVPVRTLGLPDIEIAEAATNHEFIYAVTQSMTVTVPPPDQTLGGIEIRVPGTATSLLTTTPNGPGSALYVLISPGTDGKGAWDTNGVLTAPCDPAIPLEFENCNGDAIFFGGSGMYSNN